MTEEHTDSRGNPVEPTWTETHDEGIGLRDLFAALALAHPYTHNSTSDPDLIAIWTYKVADAMLEERKENDEERNNEEI